jgi:hypothetical protein
VFKVLQVTFPVADTTPVEPGAASTALDDGSIWIVTVVIRSALIEVGTIVKQDNKTKNDTRRIGLTFLMLS